MTLSEATVNASTTVYRLFDAGGRLLYVGASRRPQERIREHRHRSWWPRVAKTTLTEYPDRAAALNAETVAIVEELPAYNVLGRPGAEWGSARSGLRIHGFPVDLLAEARAEAAIDGETLGAFAIEAVRREIERRQAIPVDDRRRLLLERRAEERRQRRAQRLEARQ